MHDPLVSADTDRGAVPPEPPEVRRCACGCGATFATRNPKQQRYASPAHYPRKGSHYTADEKRERKVLEANPPNGQPCPRCGQPMTRAQWAEGKLQTGHVIDRCRGSGMGLRWEHARCNMGAGGTLGRAIQVGKTLTHRSRDW